MPAALTISKLIAAVDRRGFRVTASTLRFWESCGLVEPDRTASGYRQYHQADVDRVELICRLQGERHMPLTAIADYLDALDRGLEPNLPDDSTPEPPRIGVRDDTSKDTSGEMRGAAPEPADSLKLTADELCEACGIDAEFLASLQSYGLLGDFNFYGRTEARIAAAARVLADHGIEPRHLRPFNAAAERELALVDAVMAPSTRTLAGTSRAGERTDDGDDRVPPEAGELATACGQLHAALLMAKLPGRY